MINQIPIHTPYVCSPLSPSIFQSRLFIYFHTLNLFCFLFFCFSQGWPEKEEEEEKELLMRLATVYGYAKEGSGELRPGIKTVEEAVKSVVGPVHEKFHLVPDEILRHADTGHHHDHDYHRTAFAAQATASEMAMRLYAKCEPVAEQCVASVWRRVKRSPLLPRMANAVVPKAAYCTEKYNEAVVAAAEKGCMVSAYLPLVHTERRAKLFSEFEA